MRRPVVRPHLAQRVQHVLGVAQIGEIGNRCDDHLVDARQHRARPFRPCMRNIEHGDGRAALQNVEHRLEGLAVEIIGTVEQRGRGKQRQMLGAFRQQAVEEDLVETIGCEDRFGDALGRILIEVDVRRAIGQVEIGEDRLGGEEIGNAKGAIMRDGRGAGAPFEPMKAMLRPSGSASGSTKIEAIAVRISGMATG